MKDSKSTEKDDQVSGIVGEALAKPSAPSSHPVMKIHELTTDEKQLLQNLNIQVLNAKGAIYDLNIQLEQKQKELMTTLAGMNAGLAAIGASAGIERPQISSDFAKISGMSRQRLAEGAVA